MMELEGRDVAVVNGLRWMLELGIQVRDPSQA